MRRSVLQTARRPLMWFSVIFLPLLFMLFMTSLFEGGLPTKVPAAIVDLDGTGISREVTQTLGGMQMVDIKDMPNSYTQAREAMQRGEIYGFFLIPRNYEADLLAGRAPEISFFTNMAYFVPGTMLFKTFKTTALYTKAGIAVTLAESLGENRQSVTPLLQPVSIQTRPIGNPWLNYGIYLANSFIPAAIELMIFLVTVFSLGEEIKRHTSPQLMQMARGSILRAVTAKILPQTLIWWAIVILMTSWLFKFNHYTMAGSWGWLILSQLLFVLACQGFALFIFGLTPNLRLALSTCALLGILAFSIAAFSFPDASMYPAVGIFTWLLPVRYNFLIYSDIALNGRDIFYARLWFVAYIAYIAAPVLVLPRIKKAFLKPVYVP